MKTQPTGLVTPDTLQVGDQIASRGDRSISGVSGTVTKVNRVTFVLSTTYFNKPMILTMRCSNLRGELRAIRNGQLLSSLYIS